MNRHLLASLLFWTGLIILNYWIFTFLGIEYHLERMVAMFCISSVSVVFFYLNPKSKEMENENKE